MATLKNLIDETTDIKNEIVECKDTLKQILVNKRIEGLENENKISILIDKTNDLVKLFRIKGDTYISNSYLTELTIPKTQIVTYTLVDNIECDGDYNVDFRLYNTKVNLASGSYVNLKLIRLSELIEEKSITVKACNSSWVKFSTFFDDVKNGDTIVGEFYSHDSYGFKFKEFYVRYDLEIVK